MSTLHSHAAVGPCAAVISLCCALWQPLELEPGGGAEAPATRDESPDGQPGLLAELADDSPHGLRARVRASLEDLLQGRNADLQAGLEGTPFVIA